LFLVTPIERQGLLAGQQYTHSEMLQYYKKNAVTSVANDVHFTLDLTTQSFVGQSITPKLTIESTSQVTRVLYFVN
jgi:hypothetical protein